MSHSGRVFVSYKRERAAEIAAVVDALHDIGVPTWLDTDDLRHAPTEVEIERAVMSASGAILYVTPEVARSSFILRAEIGMIFDRYRDGDGFWVLPVAAAGMSVDDVEATLSHAIRADSLRRWNLLLLAGTPGDAQLVARAAIRARLDAVTEASAAGSPLTLSLSTFRADGASQANVTMDWTRYYADGARPSPDDWTGRLLPSLRDMRDAVERVAGDRTLEADGKLSLSAAFALGSVFQATRGSHLVWRQALGPGAQAANWSLGESAGAALAHDRGWRARVDPAEPGSRHLAVLLNIKASVRNEVERCRQELPSFRAILTIDHVDAMGAVRRRERRPASAMIQDPAEAASLARLIADEIRAAIDRYDIGMIHIFFAGPAGLAVMIGQLTNTFPSIATYDLVDEIDAAGLADKRYRPAVTLRPRTASAAGA